MYVTLSETDNSYSRKFYKRTKDFISIYFQLTHVIRGFSPRTNPSYINYLNLKSYKNWLQKLRNSNDRV